MQTLKILTAGLVVLAITFVAAGPVSAKKPIKPPPPADDLTNPALAYGVGEHLMLITSDGTASQRVVSGADGSVVSPRWTPDGLMLGYEDRVVKKLRINKYITTYPMVARDLYTVPLDGSGPTWVRSTFDDGGGDFQWIDDGTLICRYNRMFDLSSDLVAEIDLDSTDYDLQGVSYVGLYAGHLGPDLEVADGYQGWIAYHAQTAPNSGANPCDVWIAQLEIVEEIVDGQTELVVTVANDSFARLTLPGSQIDPTWSPDGTQLLFYDTDSGPGGGGKVLRVVDVDFDATATFGSPSHVMTVTVGAFQGRPAWSPDGEWVAVSWLTVPSPAPGESGEADLYRIRPDASGLAQLTFDADVETAPRWNPLWVNDLDD